MDLSKLNDKSWKIGILIGLLSLIMILILSGFQHIKSIDGLVVSFIIFLVYFLYGTLIGFVLLNTITRYKDSSNLVNILKIILITILFFLLMVGLWICIVFLSPVGLYFTR